MHRKLGHDVAVQYDKYVSADDALTYPSYKNDGKDVLPSNFAENTSVKTGLARRTIEEDVQIATRIPDDVRELLRSTPVAERSPRPTPTPSAPRPHPQTGKQGSSFCSSSFCWRHWLADPQDLHPARFPFPRKQRALGRGLPSDVGIPTSGSLNRRCNGGYDNAPGTARMALSRRGDR